MKNCKVPWVEYRALDPLMFPINPVDDGDRSPSYLWSAVSNRGLIDGNAFAVVSVINGTRPMALICIRTRGWRRHISYTPTWRLKRDVCVYMIYFPKKSKRKKAMLYWIQIMSMSVTMMKIHRWVDSKCCPSVMTNWSDFLLFFPLPETNDIMVSNVSEHYSKYLYLIIGHKLSEGHVHEYMTTSTRGVSVVQRSHADECVAASPVLSSSFKETPRFAATSMSHHKLFKIYPTVTSQVGVMSQRDRAWNGLSCRSRNDSWW